MTSCRSGGRSSASETVISRRRSGTTASTWAGLSGAISAREADGIIRKLSFKSFAAKYKCVIVWLPETMNEEAANKILKILEEPWEKTLFVLVSERPDLLLPTILSRTQEVVVPRLTDEEVRAELERRG